MENHRSPDAHLFVNFPDGSGAEMSLYRRIGDVTLDEGDGYFAWISHETIQRFGGRLRIAEPSGGGDGGVTK
jgi:hypothetical protein